MSADKKQIGGEHYKKHGERIQHWNVVAEMGWDYFIGNATKYLWRLGEKGGPDKAVEDISKAIHYLEKKRELMMGELHKSNQYVPKTNPEINALKRAEQDVTRAYNPMIPTEFLKVSDVTGPGPGPGYVNQDR